MTINYHPLTEYEFLIKYLEITNLLLDPSQQLTHGEMELIASITILPEEKFKYQRFSMGAKKRVVEHLKITIPNINNRIHALTTKGFLRRDEDKVLYLPKHLLNVFSEFQKGSGAAITFKMPQKKDDTSSNKDNSNNREGSK